MSKISLIRATILLIEKILHYLFFFTQNIKFEKIFLSPFQDILKISLKSSKNKLNFKVKSNIDVFKIRFYTSVRENFYSEYIYYSKSKIFNINKNFLNKIEQINFYNPLAMSRKKIYLSLVSKNFLFRKNFESLIKEIYNRINKFKKKKLIIYSPPKTGSTTFLYTAKKYNIEVIRIHNVNLHYKNKIQKNMNFLLNENYKKKSKYDLKKLNQIKNGESFDNDSTKIQFKKFQLDKNPKIYVSIFRDHRIAFVSSIFQGNYKMFEAKKYNNRDILNFCNERYSNFKLSYNKYIKNYYKIFNLDLNNFGKLENGFVYKLNNCTFYIAPFENLQNFIKEVLGKEYQIKNPVIQNNNLSINKTYYQKYNFVKKKFLSKKKYPVEKKFKEIIKLEKFLNIK